MTVELIRARPHDVPTLRRLVQLYLYDLATIDGWDVGDDGAYGSAEQIERFWTEPERHAFLVRADGKLAGFVLLRRGARATDDPAAHEVSEFFVLRRFRRRGVGERVARQVFDMFPGPWEVAEMASNLEAQTFWRAVIGRYTGNRFTDADRQLGGAPFRVQHFDTRRT